jgi:hypothetical protein
MYDSDHSRQYSGGDFSIPKCRGNTLKALIIRMKVDGAKPRFSRFFNLRGAWLDK